MRAIAEGLRRTTWSWPVLGILDPAAVVIAGLVRIPSVEPMGLAPAVVAMMVVCGAAGLHRRRLVPSILDDLPTLAAAAVLVTGVLAVTHRDPIPVHEIGLFGATIFVATIVLRIAAYALVRLLRHTGRTARPVVIVGAGSIGRQLVQILMLHGEFGLRPVGVVDSGPAESLRGLPLPLLGDLDDLDDVLAALRVEGVIFDLTGPPDRETIDAARSCLDRGDRVFVLPPFHEAIGVVDRRVDVVRGIPLLPLRPQDPIARLPGRLADLVVATAAVIVLLPTLLLIGLAVRLETGATPLVRHPRLTSPLAGARPGGRLRFRTLRPADFGPSEVTSWRIDPDTRTGPVGRFLRRTGIDELPELLDVIRGERGLLDVRTGPSYDGGRRVDRQVAADHGGRAAGPTLEWPWNRADQPAGPGRPG